MITSTGVCSATAKFAVSWWNFSGCYSIGNQSELWLNEASDVINSWIAEAKSHHSNRSQCVSCLRKQEMCVALYHRQTIRCYWHTVRAKVRCASHLPPKSNRRPSQEFSHYFQVFNFLCRITSNLFALFLLRSRIPNIVGSNLLHDFIRIYYGDCGLCVYRVPACWSSERRKSSVLTNKLNVRLSTVIIVEKLFTPR